MNDAYPPETPPTQGTGEFESTHLFRYTDDLSAYLSKHGAENLSDYKLALSAYRLADILANYHGARTGQATREEAIELTDFLFTKLAEREAFDANDMETAKQNLADAIGFSGSEVNDNRSVRTVAAEAQEIIEAYGEA